MSRPLKFEAFRYVGDKRRQVFYDLDLVGEVDGLDEVIDELMASEQFAAFSPDAPSEARNRGYRAHRSIREAAEESSP